MMFSYPTCELMLVILASCLNKAGFHLPDLSDYKMDNEIKGQA